MDENTEFKRIAERKASEQGVDIYVVAEEGSYLYLTFNDDFSWNNVLFVAKSV